MIRDFIYSHWNSISLIMQATIFGLGFGVVAAIARFIHCLFTGESF